MSMHKRDNKGTVKSNFVISYLAFKGSNPTVWTRKEVKLSHLKVFGYVLYIHNSDNGINKLDVKSLKCSFISYDGDDFSYKF